MKPTILVTGATSGLGLSHSIFLSYKGYDVIGIARSVPSLEELEERYRKDHRKYKIKNGKVIAGKSTLPADIESNLSEKLELIRFYKCDITSTESMEELFNSIDKLDVLVNNAGFGLFGSALQLSLEKEREQFEVNVIGQLEMVKRSLPLLMKSNQAKIINTASLAAYYGIPFQGHYSASKAAIHKLSESLRLELKPTGIQVCTLDPGDINTPFNSSSVRQTTGQGADMLDLEGLMSSLEYLPLPSYLDDKTKEAIKRNEREVWRNIVKNLVISPPPLVVSRKLEKIIRKRKCKVHYKVGSRFQVIAISAAQRLFTDNFANWLMGKFYGL